MQELSHDQIEERLGIVAFVCSVLVEEVEVDEQVTQVRVRSSQPEGQLDDLRAWCAVFLVVVVLAMAFDLVNYHVFCDRIAQSASQVVQGDEALELGIDMLLPVGLLLLRTWDRLLICWQWLDVLRHFVVVQAMQVLVESLWSIM